MLSLRFGVVVGPADLPSIALSLHASCQRPLIRRVLIFNGFFGVTMRKCRIPEVSAGRTFGFPRGLDTVSIDRTRPKNKKPPGSAVFVFGHYFRLTVETLIYRLAAAISAA
jgi:hypothetical protein